MVWDITIDGIMKDILNLPEENIKVIGDSTAIRGRRNRPSILERNFWNRFPELLFDDPEDKHNEIIGILRNTATKYFKEKK